MRSPGGVWPSLKPYAWFKEILLMRIAHLRPLPIVRQYFLSMGTHVTVTVSPGDKRRRADARAAIAEVQQMIADFGHDWWAWGGGALGNINRTLASGATATIPPDMQPLFRRAWAIHRASGGLFEPRIASLVRRWGFDDVARIRSEPPPAQDVNGLLNALRSAPDYQGGDRYGPAPEIGWDFGGIAKGYVIDCALELLRARGFGDATIDAGGNVAVRGVRGDRPWRIGIRNPRVTEDSPLLLAALDTHDESVNTHGDDQRFFDYEGRRYSHILDPLTGAPAQGLRSLTVVHKDGTLAEAGGAALFVAGEQGWPALARQLGIAQVMVVTDDGRVLATPTLAARLRMQTGVELQIVG